MRQDFPLPLTNVFPVNCVWPRYYTWSNLLGQLDLRLTLRQCRSPVCWELYSRAQLLIAPNSQGERKKGELITFLGQRSLLLNACVDLSSGVYRTRTKEYFFHGASKGRRDEKNRFLLFSLLSFWGERRKVKISPLLRFSSVGRRRCPSHHWGKREGRSQIEQRGDNRWPLTGTHQMGKGVSESSLANYSGNCSVFPCWKTVLNILFECPSRWIFAKSLRHCSHLPNAEYPFP